MPLKLFVDLYMRNYIGVIALIIGSFSVAAQTAESTFVLNRRLASTPNQDRFWQGMSSLSYPLAIGTPLIQLGLGYGLKKEALIAHGWQAVGGVAMSAVAGYALKETIRRQRPFQANPAIQPYQVESGYSFPSGTTTLAFTWATQLTMSCPAWYVAVPAYAVAGTIGFSRIPLGAHYPTDVLAGAVLGTSTAFLSQWLTKKIRSTK